MLMVALFAQMERVFTRERAAHAVRSTCRLRKTRMSVDPESRNTISTGTAGGSSSGAARLSTYNSTAVSSLKSVTVRGNPGSFHPYALLPAYAWHGRDHGQLMKLVSSALPTVSPGLATRAAVPQAETENDLGR